MVGLGWFLFPFYRGKHCYFIVLFVLAKEYSQSTRFKEHQKFKVVFSHHIFQYPDAQSILEMKNVKGLALSKRRSISPHKLCVTSHKYHIRIAKHPEILVALWKDLLETLFILLLFSLYINNAVCTEKHWECLARISLWGSVLLFTIFVYTGRVVRWLQPELGMTACCLKRLDTWRLKTWVFTLVSPFPAPRSWMQLSELLLTLPHFTMNVIPHLSHGYEN